MNNAFQQNSKNVKNFAILFVPKMDKLHVQIAPTKIQLERFFYHHLDLSRV